MEINSISRVASLSTDGMECDAAQRPVESTDLADCGCLPFNRRERGIKFVW